MSRVFTSRTIFSPGTLDAATVAWVAAVITNGGTVSGNRATLVNDLITRLKGDGVWTKLDRLWLLAGENQPAALTDLIATALATAVNSPSFATDRGFTGVDSSTSVYIDTNFNASTAGGNHQQNAAHISAWSNTNAASGASGGVVIGTNDGAQAGNNGDNLFPKFNDGNAYGRINSTGLGSGVANANSTGHYIANRTHSTNTDLYKNGSSITSSENTSQAQTNSNMYVLGCGPGGVGGAYQICMSSIGGVLTGTEAGNFYTHLRTYMTAVGVP